MGQIFNIGKSWISYIKGETNLKTLGRATICKKCPNAIIGTYEKFMPDETLKEIQGLKCNLCKCPLSTKLRSKKEKCPIGKWE